MVSKDAPTIDDVRAAAARIAPYLHRTPVLTCAALDGMCGAELFFKCESFQKVGSFKARGATNAVLSLSEAEAARGVATHSSGNHAAALAYAARCRSTTAYVAMPRNAPDVKKRAVAGYGAEIVECEPTLEAREATLRQIVERTGAVFVPPYNDHRVIAGQGTAALELLDEVTDLDAVIVPVGGGGLLSGTAITVAALSPETLVFGAEPQQADDAYRSLHAGHIIPATNPATIADGLRTSLGTLTFPIIHRHVRDIVTVSEEAIVEAMRHIWQRMKVLVEPSAAVPVAALLEKRDQVPGRRIGIILSGGNADLDHLPW
ncbi:MAG: pyridoxal-phosphate dependent enzyme [Verrucomicrobia bacterium]|nr:pyridoxal-phosphate dependent enzyme [Verrucomicrobiota bacterium]